MNKGNIDKGINIEENSFENKGEKQKLPKQDFASSFEESIKRAKGHDLDPEKAIPELNKTMNVLKENLFGTKSKMDVLLRRKVNFEKMIKARISLSKTDNKKLVWMLLHTIFWEEKIEPLSVEEYIIEEMSDRLFPEYDGEKVVPTEYGWSTPEGEIRYIAEGETKTVEEMLFAEIEGIEDKKAQSKNCKCDCHKYYAFRRTCCERADLKLAETIARSHIQLKTKMKD